MYRAATDIHGGFFDRFGQTGMAVTYPGDILCRGTQFHTHHDFLDKITSRWANDMGTQNGVRYLVGQNFRETVGIRIGPST